MQVEYKTRGTCSSRIKFDLEEGKVRNLRFAGGCHGNLQAIARLVEGMPAEEVAKLLSGIRCGFKNTSCGDQLAKAITEAIG